MLAGGKVTDQQTSQRGGKWPSLHTTVIVLTVFGILAIPIGIQINNVIVAEATWPGTVAESIYRQGHTYSERVTALKRQEALGWQVQVTVASSAQDPVVTQMQIDLHNGRGEPVIARTPRVTFVHPHREALDSKPIQLEAIGAGRYQVEYRLPQAGKWSVQFVAQAADGTPFRQDVEIRIQHQ